MARTGIVVDVSAVESRLKKAETQLSDWSPALRLIAQDIKLMIADQFDTQGRGNWVPLSPRYARWKAAHYPNRPIGVRTGHLRDTFTGHSGDYVEVVETHKLSVGSNLPYAAYFSRRRPIYDPTATDFQSWMSILEKYVHEAIAS